MGTIAENLHEILQDIHSKAKNAGRNPEEIQLVAVSKFKPVSDIQEAVIAGQVHFGENRPQELRDKQEELPQLKWHMIGRLQRNKVKYIAPFVHLIHSVDSVELLEEIEKEGRKNNRVISCLVQMNISDEDQKGGGDSTIVNAIFERCSTCSFVKIEGLMGMAEFTDDESVIRSQFRYLKQSFDSFAQQTLPNNVQMKELSMGMTGDYHLAIAEGATLLRIGSAIFGNR